MKLKKLLYGSLLFSMALTFGACSEDELGESIFDTDIPVYQEGTASYKLDKWLSDNYLDVYNLDFRYRMQDVGADMNFNLVPASLEKATDMAVLTKYLWFDVYKEVVNPDFLKQYGPRIIHLIGSPAFNPANGTLLLGLAEGGIKVTLFRVNYMDLSDFNQLNEFYFKTMHHEFSHILHQTKTYPKEWNTLSAANYDPFGWQDRNGAIALSLGCMTSYGSSQAREDFAETIANYITKTEQQWELMQWVAEHEWFEVETGTPKKDAYCFYYYKDEAAKERDDKTNIGRFVEANSLFVIEGMEKVEITKDDKGNETYKLKGSDIPVYAYGVKGSLDKVDGKELLLQKVNICRQWFKDAWNMDLDKLREEVQYRQTHIDIDALRAEVENVQ